jgi:LysM repeat protein
MKYHLLKNGQKQVIFAKEEIMTTKRFLILLALASFALILAACELSASTPPPASPTPDSAMSTLQAELGNIATQTAVAGGGGGTGATQPPTGGTPDTTPATTPGTTPAIPSGSTPAATEAPPEEPAPEEEIEVPTATPGIPKNYTIERGEFPFCIARRFNVNVGELLNLNGLSVNSLVSVGYTLKIPQTGNKFDGDRSLRKHPTTYTVSSGDTIFSVACLYGNVDPYAIAQKNGLKKPYTLKAGETIKIP